MSKRVLGRGLSALIPDQPIHGDAPVRISEIRLDQISPNPEQPRREMSPEALDDLAASIRLYGVIEPVVVRRHGDRFELIAGERRVLAARKAGLAMIPAVERDANEDAETRLALALIENVQRENLNPIEEAEAYERLHAEFGLTQDDVARRVGKSRTAVANTLRLLQLPKEIRADVSRGTVSAGHARAILSLESEIERRALWKEITAGTLSVRQAESAARVRAGLEAPRRPRTKRAATVARPPELGFLEDRMRESLGTQVKLVPSGRGGTIEISYYDDGDLERILEILGVEETP